MRHDGEHIKLWAAHGSHASYPRCDEWERSGKGVFTDEPTVPDDYTCDGPVATFGTDTRLINIARSPWACWQGRFGEPGPNRSTRADGEGPESPLIQQKDYYAIKDPCKTGRKPDTGPLPATASGRAAALPSANSSGPPAPDADGDPDSLESEIADEADLPQADVVKREQAGAHYDRYFDDCGDWNTPPLQRGIKIVACDQRILSRFFAGGLEDPGPERLRVVDPAVASTTSGGRDAAIPAVYETEDPQQAARLRVVADTIAKPSISAYEREVDGSSVQATFPATTVAAGGSLQVRRGDATWRLVDAGGRVVATARARRLGGKPVAPTAVVARRKGSALRVRWRTKRQPLHTRFVIYGARAKGTPRRRLRVVPARGTRKLYRTRFVGVGPAGVIRVVALSGDRRVPSKLVRVQR